MNKIAVFGFRVLLIIIFVLVILRLLLLIMGKNFVTLSTFPRMGKEEIKIADVEKIYLDTKDGKKIMGVYMDNKSEKTVFYFHGNGGSLNIFYYDLKYFYDLGFNVIAYDFPGYGESEGFPYEKNVYEATDLFYDYLIDEKKANPENIILVGYSIGTAPAIELASKNKLGAMVLIAPLTSRYEMAKHYFGLNLIKISFNKDSFVSKDKIKKISIPTLIMHGDQDTVIPNHMGKTLFELSAAEQKIFVNLVNIGHNGILYYKGDSLKPIISSFLSGDIMDKYIDI